ncbi:MAG: phage holin family protein [Chitinophagaceae bacterium]|nr:phage holin family protein [Chitinophagaceae bacterium]
MSNPTLTLIESLINKSHEYAETRLDLFKLKLVDKSSQVVSTIASGIALFVIGFIFFIVFNIGLALLIGDLVGKSYWGFFILAAFYAFIGFIFYKNRNRLFKKPILGTFLKKIGENKTSWDN